MYARRGLTTRVVVGLEELAVLVLVALLLVADEPCPWSMEVVSRGGKAGGERAEVQSLRLMTAKKRIDALFRAQSADRGLV